jgi:hypothetical protein
MCDHAEYCFPCSTQGIYFYDITTLLLDTEAFHNVIDMLVERYKGRNVEAVAGMACNVAAVHTAPDTVSMARSQCKRQGTKQIPMCRLRGEGVYLWAATCAPAECAFRAAAETRQAARCL